MDKHVLGGLRHAALSPFDIKILTILTQTGGEFPFYIGGIAEENQPDVILGLSSLANRDLIAVDEARSTVSRWVLKFTDYGRAVAGQLERMSVQPRVEVQMHGDRPEVVKP
jgi:hypothetical protein